MSTQKYLYFDCPSCGEKMGPYTPKDLRAKDKRGVQMMSFVGCAQENTDKPHRYTPEQADAMKYQIAAQLLRV